MESAGSPDEVQAIHNSTTPMHVPQMGVHKPRSKSIPAPAPIQSRISETKWDASAGCPNAEQNRKIAVTARWRRRPVPGQLLGNAEKRRCKSTPFCRFELRVIGDQLKTPKWKFPSPPFGREVHSSMIPRFNPIVTACVRSLASSLESMLAT
jgi:hypothetical protein